MALHGGLSFCKTQQVVGFDCAGLRRGFRGVHRVHVHPPLEPEFKYSFVIKSTTAIIIYIVCDSCGYDNST